MKNFIKPFLLTVFIQNAYANNNLTDYLEHTSLKDMLAADYLFDINNQDYQQAKDTLWQKFKLEAQNLPRKKEHEQMSLNFADKKMRFGKKVKDGNAAHKPLYIALHGGGQTAPRVNDSQWEHMKIYYLDSVRQGTYVATRGITNNWNLHFENESYPLYDKLIENMIVYEGVDPNRVYLTGFSAGGDGVYQITARMNDRFAATNMSAGHHNWVSFENLYNTPMLIQLGEYDSAYKRNTVAVENYLKLNDLQTSYHGGYEHDVFLHLDGSHNSWQDNDASQSLHPIIAHPKAWLDAQDRASVKKNTNAITWLDQHVRNPLPTKIVWDLNTKADLRNNSMGKDWLAYSSSTAVLAEPVNLSYWLNVSDNKDVTDKATHKLVVSMDKPNNSINIEQVAGVDHFSIYLHPDLLDLSKDINIQFADQKLTYKVNNYSVKAMLTSMLERTDYNWSFPAEVKLSLNAAKQWEIAS